ncbi:MAG: conjugal transfer protein [Solirubrobacterales bacterium]
MPYGFVSRLGRGGGESRTLGAALRPAGRIALWAVVGLLLLRGAADVLGPETESRQPVDRPQHGGDPAAAAFAIRFARTYLEAPSREALAPFLAAGAKVGAGRPASARGAQVAQAEAVRFSPIGDGRVIVTVACELRDSRTLYLAVPIVRFGAGEVAALGAPSIVAVPAVAGADPERPRPLTGPDAAAIKTLVEKFLPAYLAAARSSDLAYLLAPGASVVPLGGALEPLGSSQIRQLAPGEGAERTVLAELRVHDPSSGAAYPLAYRLRLERRGARWYVAAVQGAVA